MFWYTVQQGDTLYTLAKRCGTTPDVLARLNGVVDPANLMIGRRLRLPCPLRPARPSRPPMPPRPPMPSPPRPDDDEDDLPDDDKRVYVVQPGDTLFSIAAANGTTVEALVQLNRIYTPNLIFPGDRLRLY